MLCEKTGPAMLMYETDLLANSREGHLDSEHSQQVSLGMFSVPSSLDISHVRSYFFPLSHCRLLSSYTESSLDTGFKACIIKSFSLRVRDPVSKTCVCVMKT